MADAEKCAPPHPFAIWMQAVRAYAFPASALPVILGTFAATPLGSIRWGLAIGSLVSVLLMHSAGNLLNDYFDLRYGVDKPGVEPGRPGGVLRAGFLTPSAVFIAAFVCLAIAAPISFIIVYMAGFWALFFGLCGVFALYAYTGPPFTLKYRALGEPLIFIVYGPFPFLGAAYVQTGRLEMLALLYSIPVGMLIVAILLANNARDLVEDRASGIATLAIRLGPQWSRRAYAFLLIGAPCSLVLFAALDLIPKWPLLAIAAFPAAIPLLRKDFAAASALADLDARTVGYMALFSIFLLIGIL